MIPCGRARERTGQQQGLLCGPWWAGVGGKRLQRLLEFLSSPSVSSGVMQLEVEEGPNVIFPLWADTQTHTSVLRMIFFRLSRARKRLKV